MIVFSGKVGQDDSQGVIIVERRKDGRYLDTATYPTPAKSGAVRVTAENGGRLTLQSEQGSRFMFDLVSRTYVANLGMRRCPGNRQGAGRHSQERCRDSCQPRQAVEGCLHETDLAWLSCLPAGET
jgi:hypothetical protein